MASSFRTILTSTGRLQRTCGSRLGEPYVAVTSVDLRPRAEVEVFLYGAWQSTHLDDNVHVAPLIWREGVWELDLFAPPMAHPNEAIFLIALMEHFNESPCILGTMIRDAAIKALDASPFLARETRIARLIDALDRSVNCANGGPNLTSVVEVSLSADDITLLETFSSCRFVRSFCGYGGQYCLGIELKAQSVLWTLVPRQHDAFAAEGVGASSAIVGCT